MATAPLGSAFRDMSLPYTENELEGLRRLFRTMPTFKNGFISTSKDFPQLIEVVKWGRTPEQVQNYVDYFHLFYGGKLSEEDFISLMKSEHQLSLFALETAKKMDMDKNGFISADEFKVLMKFLRIHDPKLKQRDYEDFLREGSTDKDGRVNIDECAKWIQKNI